MAGERDLGVLIAGMRPRRRPGEVVIVAAPEDAVSGLRTHAMVREDEGTTFVLDRADADARGLPYEFVAAWITLTVHSALDAVGLTAAVSARLAGAGIPCNLLAGALHDHILVPADRADDALGVLRAAAGAATG